MMAEGGQGEGSEMELEAGEVVMDGSDLEMPGLSGETRSAGNDDGRLGSNGTNAAAGEEDSASSKDKGGISGSQGDIPQDVLLAAEAAASAVNGNGNGVKKESEEEEDEDESDDEDANVGGMVEEDSDPLVESDESSDASSDEEDDVNAADMQKSLIEGAEELQTMVERAKDGDSDEEDGASEPPRTANEVTELPPVPEIEVVLESDQIPQQVGVVSSIMDKKVIVEAIQHEMVLNEGSILWLTEQRKPLGIIDEVFGPVKKPYYVVRYNKAADVPEVASQGITVGFVQEFASFVLNEPELRKKGYDASGQHDEEISDEEEFSDDEKEEEAKRLRKLAAKQKQEVMGGGDMGRSGSGGRGMGGDRGGRHKGGGRNGGRGRGGGRGRFSRSDSAKMLEVDDTTKARAAGMGHQRSNSLGSPVFSRDLKGPGGDHHRGQFHPSPDRQNSWNRSPRSDITYSQVPDLRSPMGNYNERQSLPYQSPHHDFVSGIRPIQQPPHLSPQRSVGPVHWGPSSGALHGEVHQVQGGPFLGSGVRWPHQPTGDYQHPEAGMYQARVNLVPMASFPLPQQMSMYAPPPQPVGTGVFIPPAQYSRNSQGNQMAMQQQQQAQGSAGQMQGAVHPSADGRGLPAGQWPVNGGPGSIVTGIPCYSNPPQPVYLQPGGIRPGMIAPGPNNVYWSNNPGR